MKKLVGYVVAIVGLAILVVNTGVVKINSAWLNSVNPYYVLGAGIGLVLLGVAVVLLNKDSEKTRGKKSEEVPIYEGTGKKRKIVGYQKI